MLFSLPQYLGLDSFSGPLFRRVFGYLSLALALPVVLYKRRGLLEVGRTLGPPADALTRCADCGRLGGVVLPKRLGDPLRPRPGYLDSLAGLVFFLLCGRVFQQMTHDRLAFDRDYRSFFPLSITRKVSPSPREERISLSRLEVGDRLLIRHGELIPADAILVAGRR